MLEAAGGDAHTSNLVHENAIDAPAAEEDILCLLCHSTSIPQTCVLLPGTNAGAYWVRSFNFWGPSWESVRYEFQSKAAAYRWLQMHCFYKVDRGGYYDTFLSDPNVEDKVVVVDMAEEERFLKEWQREWRKQRGWLAPVKARIFGWLNSLA